jgi:hypothetical protein
MRSKLLTLALAVCLSASAQMRMSSEQLVGFVKSSIKLGHEDKRIADYLKKVKLTDRLTTQTVAELEGQGVGAKTLAALYELQEGSKELPVTQSLGPAPPPKVIAVAPKPPSQEEIDKVLADVTEYARNYTKQLPNFICVQRTLRNYDPTGKEDWRRDATLTAQLSYNNQKEDYKIIMVDNKSTVGMDFERVGGATSTGEFGSLMKEIFDKESLTFFRWERWATLHGRRMHVFFYRVGQPQSKWSIRYQRSDQITPGYSGLVFVDRDTGMIMRITMQAEDIPLSFPVQQASMLLDYDFVKISEREFVLPIRSEMRMREARMMIKNETEFRLYRKFTADTVIKAIDIQDLPPLPEGPAPEQPASASSPKK